MNMCTDMSTDKCMHMRMRVHVDVRVHMGKDACVEVCMQMNVNMRMDYISLDLSHMCMGMRTVSSQGRFHASKESYEHESPPKK